MGDRTGIEWTEASWNPVTGCDKVSPGCDHCYAETLAERFRGTPGHYYEQGFDVVLRPAKLDQPLRWTRPRRIFVNSMSDLFHDAIPDEYIAKVWALMALAPQHTFQVLTKRHGRMRSLLSRPDFEPWVRDTARAMKYGDGSSNPRMDDRNYRTWPLPNVWLGVSAEDQKRADLRIPALLDTPAAVRWISAEPLLGPIDLGYIPNGMRLDGGPRRDCALAEPCRRCGGWGGDPCGVDGPHAVKRTGGIDWVVAGGESGRGARPMHPDWARSLRDQCAAAGVAFLFKQHGEWAPVGPLYDQDNDGDADEARMDAAHAEVVEKRTVVQLERNGYVAEGYQPTDPRTWLMARVGKKAAGRELDGQLYDGYPAA